MTSNNHTTLYAAIWLDRNAKNHNGKVKQRAWEILNKLRKNTKQAHVNALKKKKKKSVWFEIYD
jgi:hypothetical protein